jgi:CBS domain-containing protein
MLAKVDAILHQKGSEVYALPPEATVFDALKTMRDKNVGALLVMREGRLIGIVSERDYARKVAIEGRDSRKTPVSEIVTSAIHTVTRETTVHDCMEIMSKHRVRHLPVLADSQVVGVISVGDLVKWIIQAQSATIDQLQSYISGQYPS